MLELEKIIDLIDDFYLKHTSINYEYFDPQLLTFIFSRLMFTLYYNQDNGMEAMELEIKDNLDFFDNNNINIFAVYDIKDLCYDFYLKHTNSSNEGFEPKFFAYFSYFVIVYYSIFKTNGKDILKGLIKDYQEFLNPNPTKEELLNYLYNVDVFELEAKIKNKKIAK